MITQIEKATPHQKTMPIIPKDISTSTSKQPNTCAVKMSNKIARHAKTTRVVEKDIAQDKESTK